VQDFLAHEGAPWAQKFAGQDPKTGNGAFASTWKAVAAQQPAAFFDAQHHYIERTHFDPVVAKVMKQTGLDITSRSPAVQDAVWSTAVQHRAAPGLIVQTVNSLRGVIAPDDPNYDRAFINKLYDIRSKYVADGHYAVGRNRYADERRDALKMLGQ
jgi:type VI secretion system secreted protein VgrG